MTGPVVTGRCPVCDLDGGDHRACAALAATPRAVPCTSCGGLTTPGPDGAATCSWCSCRCVRCGGSEVIRYQGRCGACAETEARLEADAMRARAEFKERTAR